MARYPTPAIGQRLTAEFVTSMIPQHVEGTSEPTNNTTTLSTDLQLTTPGAGRFSLFGVYYYQSTAASDLKLKILGDASGIAHATIRWGVEGTQSMQFGDATLSITVPGTGFYRAAIWATIDNPSGSAGTISLQYAQDTGGAGPTGPLSGRWLRLHQMA